MIRATPILLTGRDMTAPFLPDPLAPWKKPYVAGGWAAGRPQSCSGTVHLAVMQVASDDYELTAGQSMSVVQAS
jgi:hypothetical protein